MYKPLGHKPDWLLPDWECPCPTCAMHDEAKDLGWREYLANGEEDNPGSLARWLKQTGSTLDVLGADEGGDE